MPAVLWKSIRYIYRSCPPQRENAYLKKVVLEDECGPVNIYLLPFTKPGFVRPLFPEMDIPDYETAVRALLERENMNSTQRNILVSHQFYQSSRWETATCDSEQVLLSVGGLDRIDISVLRDFELCGPRPSSRSSED